MPMSMPMVSMLGFLSVPVQKIRKTIGKQNTRNANDLRTGFQGCGNEYHRQILAFFKL
jgi:hypothetical protein